MNQNFLRSMNCIFVFQLLHIQIFPLTVADTFVTLSWNTSRSLARDFVLQVTPEEDDHDPADDHDVTPSPPTEYSNIEVGLKMASYTLSSLRPSAAYTIRLCMKKAGTHLMEVSSTRVRTRPEHYLLHLGIEKDYTAMVAVWSLLAVFAASCVGLSAFRLYKLRCCCRLDLILESGGGDEDDDNRSTKQILSSGSEPSSIAGLSSSATATAVSNGCDRSRLVENEVASPTDDPPSPKLTIKTAKPPGTKTAVRSSLSSRGHSNGHRRQQSGKLR